MAADSASAATTPNKLLQNRISRTPENRWSPRAHHRPKEAAATTGALVLFLPRLEKVYARAMNDNEPGSKSSRRLGPAGWIAILILLGLLIWVVWYAIGAWGTMSGIDISVTGWVFIVIGVLVTLGLGGGLMALVFYSSRNDYDR
jgi:hypothetical protein